MSVAVGLKEELLRLLKEDEEFRYAVLGLLGIEEVIKNIERLQERVDRHTLAILRLSRSIRNMQRQIEALQKQAEAHSMAIKELAAKIAALGNRWGVVAEEAFRESVKYLVEDLLKKHEFKRWVYYDSEGLVYGRPSVVEVDVLVKDGVHVLVEFKSSADRSDVGELYRVGQLYEKATGVRPRLLLVSPYVRRRAAQLAKELGVEIRGEVGD